MNIISFCLAYNRSAAAEQEETKSTNLYSFYRKTKTTPATSRQLPFQCKLTLERESISNCKKDHLHGRNEACGRQLMLKCQTAFSALCTENLPCTFLCFLYITIKFSKSLAHNFQTCSLAQMSQILACFYAIYNIFSIPRFFLFIDILIIVGLQNTQGQTQISVQTFLKELEKYNRFRLVILYLIHSKHVLK